jgi:effector-binding domain-containing protein
MSLKESGIEHQKIDDMLIAGITFRGDVETIGPSIKTLVAACGDLICGPAMALYDYGAYTNGMHIEVCFPITEEVETDEITSRTLEGAEVLSLKHHGPYETVKDAYRRLFGYFREHRITGTAYCREVFLDYYPEDEEKNVTEIQAVLHKWSDRFSHHVERVLGSQVKKAVMKDADFLFTLESTSNERSRWIKQAMERLDPLATEDQRYEILSRCAHEFSEKRIDRMRAIYEQKGIDGVLEAMHEDPLWYENPVREGNILYVGKIPYNKEGHEKATTESEKRAHYCHCTLVRNHFDEISPTFCYCGAGWYRQQWEGILGKPVTIEILNSLLKGDDFCRFAIHLPDDAV